MTRIGLALGGGGVRGLAHILVLEALDELGCKPSLIAGTSMGAIIGALYASGMSGRDIKETVRRHFISKDDKLKDVIEKRADLLKWVDALVPELKRGGLIKTDRFLNYLFDEIRKTTFKDLDIPLIVIAADYWAAQEVIFESGALFPAIKASMAVPGLFAPVSIEGKVLVDGGVVNPVPYDHIMKRCDVTIAVDVSRTRVRTKREMPSVLESILGTFDIMQAAVVAEKMRHRKPDIYIRPEIRDVRMLDFSKMETVFRKAQPAIDEVRDKIAKIRTKKGVWSRLLTYLR